jgi:hypothetical protein
MRYMLLLAIFGAVFGLFAEPAVAHTSGCDSGRFHAADGSVSGSCYVVHASVGDFRCEPFAFIDGGGIGASTARSMAERMGRIDCAEQYGTAHGEVMSGTRASDGLDVAYSVRPSAVSIASVEGP